MELAKNDRTLPASSPVRAAPSPTAAARRAPWLLAVGLMLTAFNLRPAVSSLSPVLAEVRDGLGMSGTVAGMVTAVPSLCFAAFGVTAPRLARRFGPAAVVTGGLCAIAAGLVLRSLAGETALFLTASTLALAGIAVNNVLMPVLTKRYFPDRVGTVTGLYSTMIAAGTAVAAALTVPVTRAAGDSWRVGLGVWAVAAAVAVPLWVIAERRHRATADPGTGLPGQGPAAATAPAYRVTRSRTAWSLAGFFGLQATAAYVTMGWVPQMFRDAGIPASTAGLLLALIMAIGAPLGFVLPRVALRMRSQGPLLAVLGTCGLAGYAGLWIAPAGGAWAWAVLLGLANTSFPVALTLIGLRSRTTAGVARLSAFAQSTGYLISVPGPLLVGTLNEATGGWHAPLLLVAALMAVQIVLGFAAGRDRCVEDGA
ncbi:CynX/NimT family MFS transporter [Streptomyces avicenniae]|uniref:CynX/NimT family MFS transporter n=1 Tax=Streptomyces avicenniae TaxID=500153 RepID=UPI00069ADDFE|nr:MFS transporter [Streptomyces avicenniae]